MHITSISKYRQRLFTYCMAGSAIFITISMVQYPKDCFDSAIVGLNLWWEVVFPALLPFFILSEILMGLGVVHFIGVLLEPLMRPLFNVPGSGAFAMSMGLASGYPMDAVITCKFRKNNLCSPIEAERLLAFTNTADPLFMVGAVAVGMFSLPELGAVFSLAHYASSFLVGFIFRFHGYNQSEYDRRFVTESQRNIFVRALQSLYKARVEDNRSFGQLLGDSVKNSMNTILLIGGFIIVFAVLLRILYVVGVTNHLDYFFAFILSLLNFDSSLAPALTSGLFEIDLGTLAASQTNAPLIQKAAIASVIIAWSGLSVHGQVASIVIDSGIRMKPYMFARLLHAVFAGIFTIVLMTYVPYFSDYFSTPTSASFSLYNNISSIHWLNRTEQTLYQIGIFLSIALSLSMTMHFAKSFFFSRKH